MKRDALAALEFDTQNGNLCFRQGRGAVMLRLLPMAAAPVVDVFVVKWGLPRMSLFVFLILMVGVPCQIGYTAWVLRDRLLPYVVDAQAGGLWRGRRQICALTEVEGVGVVVYHGRNNLYYIAASLRGRRRPCKMLMLLTARSVHAGAQELAQRLNVPLLADTDEGIWVK